MNFEDTDFRTEILDLDNPFDIKLITVFLSSHGFEFKPDEVEFSIIIYNLNEEIIGTGSIFKQTLKFVVVDEKFRESTAFPLIVTNLTDRILEHYKNCFVYTRPNNSKLFQGLGFSEIARAEPLFSVLEFGYESIKNYQDYLRTKKYDNNTNNVASIVVNCNPFTKGHQYLIEKAASENEVLYLFIVKEDLSTFPYKIRRKLIEEGISHIKNVVTISTGPYIVSGAIFPNYFLKSVSTNFVSDKQAEIDVKIFANYVLPILKITKRYVGTEDYCLTTRAYNNAMKEILPSNGCEVIEVPRKSIGTDDNNKPNFISASKIRDAIKNNKMDQVINQLPDSTKNFLLSEESINIIEKIKKSENRH